MKELKNHLTEQGFTEIFVPSTKGGGITPRCFQGSLSIEGLDVRVDLRFLSSEYDYPEVHLTDWAHSESIRKKFSGSNVDTKGRVCHTDQSIAWWDVTLGSRFVDGVLEQTEEILRKNLNGTNDPALIVRDFNGYWTTPHSLYLAEKLGNRQVLSQHDKNQLSWLTPSNNASDRLRDDDEPSSVFWISVHLKANPNPDLTEWPPETTGDLAKWWRKTQPGALHSLLSALKDLCYSPVAKKKKKKKKKNGSPSRVGVVFYWPDANDELAPGMAIEFEFRKVLQNALRQGRIQPTISLLARDLTPITKFSVNRGDPDYIHTRNLPSEEQTLQDQRIILIGAGTIGGFLADMLCAAGAGWGSKAELTIVDPDELNIENIARHILGFDDLKKNKASALVNHLQGKFPHLNISPNESSIFQASDLLRNNSIIVNSTGCQTVSVGLERLVRRMGLKSHPTTLHAWVHGQGLAAISFISKFANGPCYRCLWSMQNDRYDFRYNLVKNESYNVPVEVGCHNSFYPYAVSASIAAANLAFRMLIDDVNLRLNHTIQFEILDSEKCNNQPHGNPSSLSTCPICAR